MKLKRILALTLSLCLLLSLTLGSGVIHAVETDGKDLAFQKLDGSKLDVDLTKDDLGNSDLTLDREEIDENQTVKVLIVMEDKSIIEENSKAVLNTKTQKKAAALEASQANVVADIEETVLDGASLEVSYSYTWLLNGVAAQVPYGTIEAIKAIDGVKQVLLQPVYSVCETETGSVAEPMTANDGVMIGRENTWAQGYTGEGLKIAIVDTGLDTDHQNFQALGEDKLTADSATRDTVAAVLSELNAGARYSGLTADDVYYSSKIAFGFNYCDDTLDITHDNDGQGDHGTHVAGIAAANKVESSDVVGVAPDAQLYVMKVFGQNGGAYAEDILAALEDALLLGADVVNMSLGSPAGFTSDGEAIDSIYNRVAQTNTVLSISAGNASTAGLANNWGTDANLTANPDNAVVGSPGTYANALSVASVENWKLLSCYIDADGYQIAYVEGSNAYNELLTTLTGEYGLVAVPGVGGEADYEGLDVTGKVALVQRGVESFADKCTYAANAGAVACIVYNNTTGTFGMDLTGCEATIPCVSISMADGEYLVSALEADPALTLSFPVEQAYVPSPEAYQMSSFSSWGPAPDLSLEPDITAPGGNIYSTLNGGEYGLMSGTSMAAPNVAGMSALVMQYVKENFDAETTDYRTLVRNLLMSTSVPLAYDTETGLLYSPRSQGSGLANAFNAVSTQAYLTVDGCDVPKAELGHDPERTGAYSFTFNVTNFGGKTAYYTLNTVAQTEDYLDYGGVYFMSGTPLALNAATAENSGSLVLTHDVDSSSAADSHDAYLIYQAAVGNTQQESWAEESFRYDVDRNETVSTDDVQAYLDALVGNDSAADLEDTVLEVKAGETAQVSVSVTLDEADKTCLDTYYENGGYVEGFTTLTARNAGGVDLSLPYLAFYGDWTEPPVLDDGYYWDIDFYAEDPVLPGNQYPHFLFTEYDGEASAFYPGVNAYVEEPFDISHMALSTNGDGYLDTIDDMYISLLRNASSLTFRYTNTQTGEVYYEQTANNVSKSVYSDYYGQIVPFVYSWMEGDYGMPLYDWKNPDGSELTNNTQLLLEVEATGVYEGEEAESWQVPITIDLEAPTLLSARRIEEDGSVLLELTFKDNHAASVVALLNGNGTVIYEMNGVEDVEPDAEGYQNYTVTYDITGVSDKLMIVLADYALNESYYGLNAGGEGTPYGDLVGFQYDLFYGGGSWVSFDADVNMDETTVFMSDANFVCAEYVNGYVFAQTETGALYGFRYEDMLADTLVLEDTYIAQLENVYQDLAYSYAEGKLYGLFTYEDGGYPTTEVYSINLKGEYYDPNMGFAFAPYQEDWAVGRGGVYGLSLAVDDAGTVYVLGPNYDWDTESTTETAHLWSVGMEYDEWSESWMLGYQLTEIGDTGLAMDYLQSMTWDHNTETLYWARFAPAGWFEADAELVTVDPETAQCTKVGTLSSETCALFAPLTAESAAKPEHANVPSMDSSVIGRPILRENTVTMNLGGTKLLAYDVDPWYSEYKEMVWSSDNEEAVIVNENGVITAVGSGSATVTVAAKEDMTLFDTVTVEVTALDLKFEGIISAQSAGLGNVTGVSTYQFEMVEGIPAFGTVNTITAPEELNFGLSLSASAVGRGSIWACESGNTGMIYEIDPATGAVKDALEPIDGDMLFGLSYSEKADTFAAIMNMNLYVDLRLTHEESEEMKGTYDEELHEFTYHKLNMLPYLTESNTGFVTGETGQGASSEIVFCGITTVDGGEEQYMWTDYMGGYGPEITYTPDQTLVLLDNVGRMWFIDEVFGMTAEETDYGTSYVSADGMSFISTEFHGVEAMADGNGTYSVFVIRELTETPLTDMFREGTMPRITYHFSDIEFAGYTAEGAPMFAMSLYDYWNNGTTNELYLYIPGVGTGEYTFDENWNYVEIKTPDRLFSLGNTGENNIIATIHSAEVTGGLDSGEETGAEGINTLTAGVYKR